MATIEAAKLSPEEHDELCCVYAALLLNDAKVEVTEDAIAKIIAASHNKVAPYWPGIFAKALKGQNITELLTAAAPAAGPAPVAAEAAETKKEVKKAEEKKVEEEPLAGGLGDIFG